MAHYTPLPRDDSLQTDDQKFVLPQGRKLASRLYENLNQVYLVTVHLFIIILALLLLNARRERQILELHLLPSELRKRANQRNSKLLR